MTQERGHDAGQTGNASHASEASYDVVVLGGGAVGENAAARPAAHGLSVALVEEHLFGGECSYYACMPSKTLLRPGEALDAVRRVPGAAEAVTGELDVSQVLARRNELASGWDDSPQEDWVTSEGIVPYRGHGRLAGPGVVEVTGTDGSAHRLRANRAVVVATGSRATIPPIDGMAETRVWDNRDITTAQEVPARLAILGGGVVGVEMAQAWRSLGAEVTLIEQGERVLGGKEPFVGEEVGESLRGLGVRVHTGTKAVRVARDAPEGPVTITTADGGEVTAEELLVAVGRTPITGDIGLESVGLEPGSYLDTDDQLRVRGVDGDWLYAVGDCNGRNLLTHMGKYHARIAGDVIAGRTGITAAGEAAIAPQVVFTTPLVSSVGLTEAGAREQGYEVDTTTHDTGAIAGAVAKGKGLSGTSQLVIDRQRRVVLGATFTGPAADELVHAATIAITGEVPLERLWHAVPSFPTVSEVWLRLLENYGM